MPGPLTGLCASSHISSVLSFAHHYEPSKCFLTIHSPASNFATHLVQDLQAHLSSAISSVNDFRPIPPLSLHYTSQWLSVVFHCPHTTMLLPTTVQAYHPHSLTFGTMPAHTVRFSSGTTSQKTLSILLHFLSSCFQALSRFTYSFIQSTKIRLLKCVGGINADIMS